MDLFGNTAQNQPFLNERVEGGLTEDTDVLSLGMEDDEIALAIGNRVTQAEAYWNTNLGLDNVRSRVDKYYLNNYYTQDDLYEFQVPYKDNRIFTAIETLVALVVSRPPQPVVMQAYDTEASYELAQNLQKALLCKYEDLYLKGKFQMVARHLLMGYRLAVMKYRWDDTIGALQEDGTRFGDVVVDVLRPHRVVLDAGAQYIDDIPLIAEYRSDTIDDLCERYPDKKEEIYKQDSAKDKSTTKKVGYLEIHFTTRDKTTGQRIEAVVWKYKDCIMDSMKSPHWNYDETYQDSNGKKRQANFLEKPTKPYVLFNFLNLGKWVLDDTSLTDQAIPMQEVLNKRGRQIVENADQANSGTIWNSNMVKQEDVAKLLGDPGERVMAKGNVTEAAARLPINMLPDYVMEDKIDARNEIDNIYSTHGAIRGEVTKSKTLGQDVMSQRGDAARINVLATAIEDGGDRLYKGVTQMFKVFYDTPQLFRYTGIDSSTNFFTLGRDQVEENIGLRVKSGSVLPEDPIAKKDETIATMAILDPLSIAEGLGKENPMEWAKRNFYYRVAPDKYMSEILKIDPSLGDTQDPLAAQHIEMLNAGQPVPPEPSPTKEHLATHQAFLENPQFKQLPPDVQAIHVEHVRAEVDNAKKAMSISERPGMPQDQNEQPQPPSEAGTPPMDSSPVIAPPPPGTPESATINPAV